MHDFRTVGDLQDAKLISEDEVEAAVAAFLVDPMPPVFVFGDGSRLNLPRAIRNHQGARVFLARDDVGAAIKRPFIRAAILQARPRR